MVLNKRRRFPISVALILLTQQITFIRSECIHGNFYTHPTDCGRFYQCSHGVLFEKICSPSLHFNPLINVCDYPANVLCEVEPETPAITTQESCTTVCTIYETTTTGITNTTTSTPSQEPTTTTSTPYTTTSTPAQEPTTTTSTPDTTTSSQVPEPTTTTTTRTTTTTTQRPITTTIPTIPISICDQTAMQWSHSGSIAGKHCVQIIEIADPHSWRDNYLCFNRDYGVRWSSNQPIAGMKCTKIIEVADPYTWDDNYLCVPTTNTFAFYFSSAGAVANLCCIQMNEPADPHTWNDNYLCLYPV